MSAWQPEPGWVPLPGGPGGAQVFAAGERVVKRLSAPQPGDAAALSDPASFRWWRREADVALDDSLAGTPGVRAVRVVAVEEDADGITLVAERAEPADNPGPLLAHALGELAGARLEPQAWWARGHLADRLDLVAARGGWRTLRRTTLADVADRLWERRRHHLAALAATPVVPAHGDPSPANLPGRAGGTVLGIDWSAFGGAPAGSDAGYLALSVREDLDVLLAAYAGGLDADVEDLRPAAVVTACYTAMSRTEWALARVAATPGALAGKYRHPSVAPYLRQLQRLFPHLETLL